MTDFDQMQLWKQINECLDRLCGKTVIEQLCDNGHNEILAQVPSTALADPVCLYGAVYRHWLWSACPPSQEESSKPVSTYLLMQS